MASSGAPSPASQGLGKWSRELQEKENNTADAKELMDYVKSSLEILPRELHTEIWNIAIFSKHLVHLKFEKEEFSGPAETPPADWTARVTTSLRNDEIIHSLLTTSKWVRALALSKKHLSPSYNEAKMMQWAKEGLESLPQNMPAGQPSNDAAVFHETLLAYVEKSNPLPALRWLDEAGKSRSIRVSPDNDVFFLDGYVESRAFGKVTMPDEAVLETLKKVSTCMVTLEELYRSMAHGRVDHDYGVPSHYIVRRGPMEGSSSCNKFVSLLREVICDGSRVKEILIFVGKQHHIVPETSANSMEDLREITEDDERLTEPQRRMMRSLKQSVTSNFAGQMKRLRRRWVMDDQDGGPWWLRTAEGQQWRDRQQQLVGHPDCWLTELAHVVADEAETHLHRQEATQQHAALVNLLGNAALPALPAVFNTPWMEARLACTKRPCWVLLEPVPALKFVSLDIDYKKNAGEWQDIL